MQKRWLSLAFLLSAAAFPGLPLALVGAVGSVACNTADLKSNDGTSGGTTSGGPGVGDDAEIPVEDSGRDPVKDLDGGVIPTSSNVTIQVLPAQAGDVGISVEDAIKAAKTSVHMTMYLLTDTSVQNALIALKNAGKDVKVILNKTFPPNGGDNTTSFNKLKNAGVDVVYAPTAYTFTHAKTIIIDNAKVLIMTMNLTQTSSNREFVATDSDPADVADCEKLFVADYGNLQVNVSGKLVVSPQQTTPVDARARLRALIDSAKTSLDVEVQSLSDDGLTDAIVLAHKDSVAVRVVIASGNFETPAQAESIAKLKTAGVPLRAVATPYIHSKVVVVDGTKVFVGSHNFTPTALLQNREIGVVTDAPAEAAKVQKVIAADFAIGVAP